MKDNKHLHFLHELSDYKVADDYPDVRDWEVLGADNKVIGKVDGLLVSKEAKRVVYLNVEVNEDLIKAGHEVYETPSDDGVHEYLNEKGENYLIIPTGMITIDEEKEHVHTSHADYTTFAKTKRYKKGSDIDRTYELEVLPHYFSGSEFDEQPASHEHFYSRKEFKR